MELVLVRHGLPVRHENAGRADPELAEEGRLQAEQLGRYLATDGIDACYSSPMRRARETAAPVGEACEVDVTVADGVAEFDLTSDWYVPVEELKAAGDPRWQAMLDGSIGVELEIDLDAFAANAVAAIDAITAAHPGGRVAVVCHGGVINAYVSAVIGIGPAAPGTPTGFFYPFYTSIHRVMVARSGERSIVSLNETAHLRGTGLPLGMGWVG